MSNIIEFIDAIGSIINGIQSLYKAVVGLVTFLFALWIGSLILAPLLAVTPGGSVISVVFTFQDAMDLFAAIVAVASVGGAAVTRSPYVLLGLLVSAVLIVFGFGFGL